MNHRGEAAPDTPTGYLCPCRGTFFRGGPPYIRPSYKLLQRGRSRLFPLAILVYRSRFLPRFLGVWLIINGFAYLIMSFTGLLLPQY